MKKQTILFYKSNTFMQDDWLDSLLHAGYTADPVTYIFTSHDTDEFFSSKFRNRLRRKHYDALVSFNYFPILSDLCNEFRIPYISWIYDSPIPLFERFDTPFNHIFHFDKMDTAEYRQKGIKQVSYLPLAVNIRRLDRQLQPLIQMPEYAHDISFIGGLYAGRSIANKRLVSSAYTQGLLEGYAACQTQFFGTDLLTDLLPNSPCITKNTLPENFPWKQLVRAVNEDATAKERPHLLKALAESFSVDLYTADPIKELGKVKIHPAVGYYTEMPNIFRHSRINLNLQYRAIRSGMSARILDIMGAGGFLMTTPQPELFDFFEPDKDFVTFYSVEELLEKCQYYLSHDEERHQIARNGYQKIRQAHTYEHRLPSLFAPFEDPVCKI